MITLGLPAAFAAGAALAALVTALHLLAPRPPERAPLPTARFLREDARTTLRFRRRPTDGATLALRVALALLLGLLFSRPEWHPAREDGTTRVVLLDRGAGMAEVWDEALALARREAAEAPALVVGFGGADEPPSVLDATGLGAARPSPTESSYLGALAALRGVLPEVPTRDVEAVLVTRPRWSAFDAQLAGLRAAAWPGALRLVALELADGEGASAGSARPERRPSRAARPTEPALRAALVALGYVFEETGAAGALRFTSSDASMGAALEGVGRGDTLVVYGTGVGVPPAPLAGLWAEDAWPPRAGAEALLVGARPLALDGVAFAPGAAVLDGPQTRWLPLVLDDGTPVAAARRIGEGCLVRFGGPIEAGAADPAYPWLVRALADGCREDDAALGPDAPLDRAARAALEGDGPVALRVASAGLPTGRPLARWVLMAVLVLALAESGWVHTRARRESSLG